MGIVFPLNITWHQIIALKKKRKRKILIRLEDIPSSEGCVSLNSLGLLGKCKLCAFFPPISFLAMLSERANFPFQIYHLLWHWHFTSNISIIFLAGLLDPMTMPSSSVIVVIQKPSHVNMMTPSLVCQSLRNTGFLYFSKLLHYVWLLENLRESK